MTIEKNHIAIQLPAAPDRPRRRQPGSRLPLRLVWYVVIPAAFVTGLFALLVAVRAAGAFLPPANAFAAYRGLISGEFKLASADDTCSRVIVPYQASYGEQRRICVVSQDDSAVPAVTLFLLGDTVTGMMLQTPAMRVIDLVWRWGPPDRVYRIGGEYEMAWSRTVHAVAESGRHYSMQARVYRITLAASSL